MEAKLILPNVPPLGFRSFSRSNQRSQNLHLGNSRGFSSRRRNRNRISAIVEVSAITSDPIAPQITWQIVVGSIAGVTPFVVAGIEFSKRIVAQKKCWQCGGSGLVLMEKEYIRCPNCGNKDTRLDYLHENVDFCHGNPGKDSFLVKFYHISSLDFKDQTH